jgi:hypothetical protein
MVIYCHLLGGNYMVQLETCSQIQANINMHVNVKPNVHIMNQRLTSRRLCTNLRPSDLQSGAIPTELCCLPNNPFEIATNLFHDN